MEPKDSNRFVWENFGRPVSNPQVSSSASSSSCGQASITNAKEEKDAKDGKGKKNTKGKKSQTSRTAQTRMMPRVGKARRTAKQELWVNQVEGECDGIQFCVVM